MKAKNYQEAWEKAGELIGKSLTKDEARTAGAGYPIYASEENPLEWVSDLGNRLEVNTADGQSVCIWIEAEADEKPLATVEKDIDSADIITAEEYNEALGEGWRVRYAFGKWAVCNGKAPEGVRVGRRDVFLGDVLKWCDTMAQADTLREALNA